MANLKKLTRLYKNMHIINQYCHFLPISWEQDTIIHTPDPTISIHWHCNNMISKIISPKYFLLSSLYGGIGHQRINIEGTASDKLYQVLTIIS